MQPLHWSCQVLNCFFFLASSEVFEMKKVEHTLSHTILLPDATFKLCVCVCVCARGGGVHNVYYRNVWKNNIDNI